MVMKLNLKKSVVIVGEDKPNRKRTFHKLNSILKKNYKNQKTKHNKLMIKKHFMESLIKARTVKTKQKVTMKKVQKNFVKVI